MRGRIRRSWLLAGALASLAALVTVSRWADFAPAQQSPAIASPAADSSSSVPRHDDAHPTREPRSESAGAAAPTEDRTDVEAPAVPRLLTGRCIDWDGMPLSKGTIYVLDPQGQSPAVSTETAEDGSFVLSLPTTRLLGDYVQATVDDEHSTVFSGLVRCAEDVVVLVQSTRHPSWRMQGRVTLIGVIPDLWSLLVYESNNTNKVVAAAPMTSPYRGATADVSILAMLPEYRTHAGPLTLCVVGMGKQRGVLAKIAFDDWQSMAKRIADGVTVEVRAHTLFVDDFEDGSSPASISLRSTKEDPPCTMEVEVAAGRALALGPQGEYTTVGRSDSGAIVVGSILALGAQNKISWQRSLAGNHSLTVAVVEDSGRPRDSASGSLGIRDSTGRRIYLGMRRSTSKHGLMQWENLAAGAYELVLQSDRSGSAEIVHEISLPAVGQLKFALGSPQRQHLRIALQADAPELLDTIGTGAQVYVRSAGSPASWRRIMLDRGLWTIPGLSPGNWLVAVASNEWRGAGATHTGSDADGSPLVADVQLTHHLPIRGTIASQSGSVPIGLRVAVRGVNLPWSQSTIDGDGSFELWSPTNHAVLDVFGPGGAPIASYTWRDGEPCRIVIR
ncbi:MAG: hypothetical protein RL398_697 [Planctomycetota bacterium]